MRKTLLLASLALTAIAVTVWVGGASATGRGPFPGDKLDLRSATPADLADLIGVDVDVNAEDGVGPNVRVNDPQEGLFGRSETSLAMSEDGKQVIAGWNDAQGFCGSPFGAACDQGNQRGLSGYGTSTSGGLNWVDPGAPPRLGTNVYTRGDPWLDRGGADGTRYFYANLAVDRNTAADLGVSVHFGHFVNPDRKNKFVWEDVEVFNSPNGANDFYDKEALVAGKGPNAGDVYVSLTNFKEICDQPQFGFGQIEVWRSHDSGATWQGPAIAGPEAPDSEASCGFEGTLQQGSAPAIAPNGHVYVVWQYGPFFAEDGTVGTDIQYAFARSTDGGVTFEPIKLIAEGNSMRGDSPIAFNRPRIIEMPRIDVDQNSGRIYVSYATAVAPTPSEEVVPCPPDIPAGTLVCIEGNLTSIQAYVKYSDDGGDTWSSAVELAPTPPATGVKRFWPDVTSDSTGTVHAVYYEANEVQTTADPDDTECFNTVAAGIRRVAEVSTLLDTMWTFSQDGGASWSMPIKLNTVTANWCQVVSNIRPNMGDYIDAQAFVPGGDPSRGGNASWVASVWADGRNGVPDTFYAHAQGPEPVGP